MSNQDLETEESTLMQVSIPQSLHGTLRRLKIDREEEGVRLPNGKKEKLENVLIYLAELGAEAERLKRESK